MPIDRTGLMIIRTWVEPGSSKPLRARIRLTRDIGASFENDITLTDIPAITAAVELWLEDFLIASGIPVKPIK